ncbi:DUF6531 domain-containing protein [Thiothrix nivea]|uniref:YD repeat protein n=1 Tax=Thiothrix nivea (strain ATCC 35100 / DSM 5205 / JP2) TaxID=870187 RepID=A0A656HMI1_THINJ|nr:DUF6531 domain-containing protein [Thiothrix nivea]EIJ36560.1 YD repeat protein [Thiothrix nivea DSM 5205]
MLSGRLIDMVTGTVLSGVTIQIDGKSVQTDAQGRYVLGDLACGVHEVYVSVNGFDTYKRSVDISSGGWLDIRLTNEKTTNGLVSESAIYGDPVNTATGNYVYQHRDLDIPGIGLSFQFDRTYNSRDAGNGPLGYGWSHNFNTHLRAENGNVTITWGDGHTETWVSDGQGGFSNQYGVFDTLIGDGGVYTLRKKNRMAYQFDVTGNLVSITDKNGNSQTLTYTSGKLTQITDTAGRSFTLAYDLSNRLVQITDPIDRTVGYTYDANGDLVTVTDPNKNQTHYTYDANHQMLTIVGPRGNTVVNNTYDADKRVVTYQTDAKGGATTYDYQELDRITTITDALGNITLHQHDDLLRLIKEVDPNGGVSLYEYDALGNRIRVTDKNGNVTQYDYDIRGNVTKKIDALGNVTIITYDGQDNPLSRTDALENTTTFSYDQYLRQTGGKFIG